MIRALLATAFASLSLLGVAVPARADTVAVSLIDLGYREGVTASGVSPSVTFDLPRYSSLQSAVLHLELRVSDAADPSSTIAVAVNGKTAFTSTVGRIGDDARLTIPLPLPSAEAELFAITVSGQLQFKENACSAGGGRSLYIRIGRNSAIAMRTTDGGSAEAFFRDYRSAITVVAPPEDPATAAIPYRIDRLEPWHRVDAVLAETPPARGRAIVFEPNAKTARTGGILTISPVAFATLPGPVGQMPSRHVGSVAFGDLRQNLGKSTGVGDLTFDMPLAGSVTGGIPQNLAVHAAVLHSALPANVTATLQVRANGVLVGARSVGTDQGTDTIDVGVPASVVGPSNSVRIVIAPEIAGTCTGDLESITASLQDSSSFSWSGVVRQPPTIESFITALNGRVIVLVAPGFGRAAFHVMGEIGKMNPAIAELDTAAFSGTVPPGYDFALVFAPPEILGSLRLPLRSATGADQFTLTNPTDDRDVFTADPATNVGVVQLGSAANTPLLAFSYHGGSSSILALEQLRAEQLATQVADISIAAADGLTTYDVGQKLRPVYPGQLTLAAVWDRIKLGVAIVLLVLIVVGAQYCRRRLTGRTI